MRVLVATDGSEHSYAAARQFVQLTHATHHHVTILYVMPLLAIGRDTGYQQIEQEKEALSALNTVKSIFDSVAVPVETKLRQGIPAEAILQVAREGDYDLIVIGRCGRGGFREFLLGSVSKTVVQKSPCAVLIGS